jgi:hypothetical protein
VKIGDRVCFHWEVPDGAGVGQPTTVRGQGVIIELVDLLHALVAVDPAVEGGPHHVIYCTLTWLTVVP